MPHGQGRLLVALQLVLWYRLCMSCLPVIERPIDRHLRTNAAGGYYVRFFYALPCKKRKAVDVGLRTHNLLEARTRAVLLLRMLHSINESAGGILGLVYPMDKKTLSHS